MMRHKTVVEGGSNQSVQLGGLASINCPSWMLKDSHQSSPPQTSVNSDSSSVQSLSSSNGDSQSRTDRIVLKLFGKDPNDFPLALRAQILDWLSHSPTDIESYIRPGCIVLTIYLRFDDSIWEELNHDLCSSLNRLLCISGDNFWKTGRLYVRLQNHMAFIYNGNIVLYVTPLLLENPNNCQIMSVTPIAVAISARVSFTVQGFNLAQPTARLLCAFEGKYLVTETPRSLVGGTDLYREGECFQCLSFSCSIPDATGRGVIEVEDHGLSSGCFLFVAAEEDVCCEIRMLEDLINVASRDGILREKSILTSERNRALNFLNEMGWLLRRSHLKHGIKAWTSARDSTGFTPEDYALARGHQSYILLLQKKINNANASEEGHVILDISGGLSAPPDVVLKQSGESKSSELTRFNIEKSRLRQTNQPSCKFCAQQQLACRTSVIRSLLCRPLMLSMVGIAAVCVCVGLLFKGPPEVSLVCPPFRWESLGYGTM